MHDELDRQTELKDAKQPHWTGSANTPATFGHFGGAGTFLWVDPVATVALVCLTDRDFGPWALDGLAPGQWREVVVPAAIFADAAPDGGSRPPPGRRPLGRAARMRAVDLRAGRKS